MYDDDDDDDDDDETLRGFSVLRQCIITREIWQWFASWQKSNLFCVPKPRSTVRRRRTPSSGAETAKDAAQTPATMIHAWRLAR